MAARVTPSSGASAKIAVAFFGALFAVALAEAVLRLSGFEYHLAPVIEVGWPDPATIRDRYIDDPDLFWVLPDYRQRLRTARQRSPSVVFMGDSCTQFGTYAERTLALVREGSGPDVEGLNVGTGGWSSEQGRVQFERDIVPLHPRVVTIYFGWNDHWIALGPTDPDLHNAKRYLWLSTHSRLAQAALKARIGGPSSREHRPNRVPIARYRENLLLMVRTARSSGIEPVLITAPSNHRQGAEPEYLAQRHVRSLAELVALHAEYLNATRAVAKDSGASLCDTAAIFEATRSSRDLFRADGIHLTAAGDELLARSLAPFITSALVSRR